MPINLIDLTLENLSQQRVFIQKFIYKLEKGVKSIADFTPFSTISFFSNYSFPNSPTALISISSLTTADGIAPIPKSVRFTTPVNLKPAIGF